MKAIALVLTFVTLGSFAAVGVAQRAGQQPRPAPREELAKVIAVEEQERDLAKAETLYREALAGTALSAQARTLANARLAALLVKLGRAEEAKPFAAAAEAGQGIPVTLDDVKAGLVQGGQDVERQKALREKARELVKQVLDQQKASGPNSLLANVADARVAEQLLWVGEAAVPEVAGALVAELPQGPDTNSAVSTPRVAAVAGLAGFLWLVGGEAAAAHLQTLVRDAKPKFRAELYRNAGQFRDARMAKLAVQLARDEGDEELVVLLLTSGTERLWLRLDVDAVVDLLVQKGPRVRTMLLSELGWGSVKLRPEALARVHGVARDALQSSDPELGRAAQRFLMSQVSQSSVEGLELLVRELPQIRNPNPNVQISGGAALPAEWQHRDDREQRMDPAAAARFWPQLVVCAHALDRGSRHGNWLLSRMYPCARELDERIVPDVLTLLPLMPARSGYNAAGLLNEKITMANAAQILAAYDQPLDASTKSTLLEVLERAKELPTELFEPLVKLAAASEREEPGKRERQFVRLLALTGHPDAAARVLAIWRANKKELSGDAWLLVGLGRRTQAEPVRAAMREMAADPEVNWPHRMPLLLALLSMHDAAALDLVVEPGGMQAVRHPYAKAEPHPSSPGVSPVQYLLYKNPDPPHRFTEDDVVRVLQKLFAGKVSLNDWSPQRLTPWAMSDRVLAELARLCLAQTPQVNPHVLTQAGWLYAVLERARSEDGRKGVLRDWIAQRLEQDSPRVRECVLEQLEPDEVKAEQARIVAFVDGEDESLADRAASKLEQAGIGIAPANLAKNRHPRLRQRVIDAVAEHKLDGQEALVLPMLRDTDRNVRIEAAKCLGALVSKEAVPGLIELLRDSDEQVRGAAADALTRIRFYHEQQAHWDRVLKGMDASPASAAEKLLLQGKPGAPKEQRLLAITSLGTLGVPEALPFLIDWTQDADADVAKAAKDAITQIHLHPRK